MRAGRDLKILDVAAGSADVTAAMASHAGKMGFKVLAVAADLNLAVLGQGRAWNREFHEISYALADGLSLPFPDDSFDIVHCSLVLHHLSEEDAVRFLKEMARVSRFAVIAGDLRRNLIPWALIWIISRLFTSNKYTRYDGPLSVLRSFTPERDEKARPGFGIKGIQGQKAAFLEDVPCGVHLMPNLKFSVAACFEEGFLEGLSGLPVHELFGKLPSDPVGGGRASFMLSPLSARALRKYIEAAEKKGIGFNYLLNAACMDNMEYTRKGQKALRGRWISRSP